MDQALDSYIQRFEAAVEKIRRRMKQDFQERLNQSQLGVTMPQFFLLHLIRKQGPCKISELAERMEVTPSAVTVMIDRLVHSGYVARRYHERDRRVVLVELTEEGRETLSKVVQIRKEIIGRYLSRISKEELDQFFNILEKLSRTMEEEQE